MERVHPSRRALRARSEVQKGQIVLVQAEIGFEERARSTAEAAYKRGAKFVDVAYFDPHVKRLRIESADPDTLDFVPRWYGERVLEHAEGEAPVSVSSHGEGYQW